MILIKDVSHFVVHLRQNGDEVIKIQDCDALTLSIEADKHIHAQLFITYDGKQMQLQTNLHLRQSSHVSILFWNQLQGELAFTLRARGEAQSFGHIGIGDLAPQKSTYQLYADLECEGMEYRFTTVCNAMDKKWQMEMKHMVGHTVGKMENFAVVKEDGDYRMVASGRIVKGAYGSESHQTSRVLTLSQKQRSEVLPILYIDENEVKASHATTLGQPDEAQLYYLQSRGLSRNAAMGLLTLGYIMPILDVVKNREWQEYLQEQIEEKVIKHD